MIPVRDTHPSSTYPVVNIALIVINVFVFLVQSSKGVNLERFVYIYGLVPARYSVPEVAAYFTPLQQVFSFVSFMFLHGGFMHLIGNMWTLFIFGDNIEDRLGHFRYLVFYFLCGLASGIVHLVFNLHSTVPVIGASGAIAGIMGAYFVLFPHSRILTIIPIIIIPWFVEIPAFIFLGLWFLIQMLNAAGSSGMGGGIAWWAHIGGFVFGILALRQMDKIPDLTLESSVRKATLRKKSQSFQVIRPVGPRDGLHLYGTLLVTPYEAWAGTTKRVDIPWGFQNFYYKVVVPPGVKEGKMLRLAGLGRIGEGDRRGDLYLKVVFQQIKT